MATKSITPASRTCKACGRELPLTGEFFGKDRKSLKLTCRRCESARARQWALENPEKDAARKREWYLANKPKTITRAIKWHADNPNKAKEKK